MPSEAKNGVLRYMHCIEAKSFMMRYWGVYLGLEAEGVLPQLAGELVDLPVEGALLVYGSLQRQLHAVQGGLCPME
eukprot:scaffold16232_cov39-Prasinocladus_malaysianus.AAC.1